MKENPRLVVLPNSEPPPPTSVPTSRLLTELQALGMRWCHPEDAGLNRRGGAGPSDHKAVTIDGETVMVPIFTHHAAESPFEARPRDRGAHAELFFEGAYVGTVVLPETPAFYALSTEDGIPYWKIATLHSHDVLATTVLQTCVRYGNRETACQFCAIGQSLNAGTTIAKKTPEQLGEVAEAAVRLSGVKHMVLTTGTPPTSDRGAAVLAESAAGIMARVNLPIQGQCEPPDDFAWFARMRNAGIVTLGMHLEGVTESVRHTIMPGKAEVPVAKYLDAFDAAVEVFGWGQVTTYILAGLGDSDDAILGMTSQLAHKGVYPFVVPFVPIAGTPLQHRPGPSPTWMNHLLDRVAQIIAQSGLRSQDILAGCGRCGACSTLRSRETDAAPEASPC